MLYLDYLNCGDGLKDVVLATLFRQISGKLTGLSQAERLNDNRLFWHRWLRIKRCLLARFPVT